MNISVPSNVHPEMNLSVLEVFDFFVPICTMTNCNLLMCSFWIARSKHIYIYINMHTYIYIHTYIQSVEMTVFLLSFISSNAESTSIYVLATFSHQLVVDWWFGAQWVWDSRGISNNPFHKGFPNIQTTNPPLVDPITA